MDKELVKVQIRSINSLKQELDTNWKRAPTETCNNLVKSMQKRCEAKKHVGDILNPSLDVYSCCAKFVISQLKNWLLPSKLSLLGPCRFIIGL